MERDNGPLKRQPEGRNPERRKETKKHLMDEGKRKEKEEGHDPTGDPATKERTELNKPQAEGEGTGSRERERRRRE